MNTKAGAISAPIAIPRELAITRVVPWTVWACLAASISIATGLYWDISWHESIGRDTFWTPAHLLIQFGGVLTAAVCAFTILGATFNKNSSLRAVSVNVLGFRGPLGAFLAAWGGIAMVTSAPFDNWWHEAYGLDVKILSPPHTVLAVGIAGIIWGGLLLTISEMNRAEGEAYRQLQWIVGLLAGFALLNSMVLKLEYTQKIFLHSSSAYVALSIGTPLIIEGLARAMGHYWARTIIAGVYTAFVLLMLWILPLFPATPKLGPVYQPITHMVPLPFPILLIVPAIVLDLTLPKVSKTSPWAQAAFAGGVYLVLLVVIQWPFASFLMSPAARNWFFNPANYPYFASPESHSVRYVFMETDKSAMQFWTNMGLALLSSAFFMWLGIVLGGWLSRLKR
jgi:hypothetical protein